METVITFEIGEFFQNHPESEEYVATWFKLVETSYWSNFDEMRKSFPGLETKGKIGLFRIGCGRYIVKARINFESRKIIVRNIMESADYHEKNQ